ncbi:MAG: dTDP-4-dehydrorhamnose 3,5-epimerase [Vicinamibacterales bacterium]
MTLHETRLAGVFLVDPPVAADDRGWFAELFQARALAAAGWTGGFVRTALSHNARRGTLRGLHFQRAPHADAKLVTCVSGAFFDVVADIRPGSPTFGRWEGFELTAANRRLVFMPEGVAHGFQTLADETTVLYHIGAYYAREAGDGIRWDDPTLAIAWPLAPTGLSDQDRGWGPLRP